MELAGVWWAVVIVLHTFACRCTTKISISLFLPLLLCYDIRIIKEKASKQVDAGIGDIRRSQSPPSAGPFFFLFLISFCVCVVSLKPTERSHYSGRCRDGLKGNDEIEFLHLLFRNSSSDGLDNRAFIQTRLIECIRMPRSIWTVSFFLRFRLDLPAFFFFLKLAYNMRNGGCLNKRAIDHRLCLCFLFVEMKVDL